VINRLAGKKSVLDLAGVLSPKEAADFRSNVWFVRSQSKDRLAATMRRIRGS